MSRLLCMLCFLTDSVGQGSQVLMPCLPAPPWNKPSGPQASGPWGGWWNCTGSSTESSARPGWTPGALPQAGHWGPHIPFWPSLTHPPPPAAGSCCSPAVCHSVSGLASGALGIGTAGLTGASGQASANELPAKRAKQSHHRRRNTQYHVWSCYQ